MLRPFGKHTRATLFGVALVIGASAVGTDARLSAAAAATLTLTGSITQNCTVNVTADPGATTLNLTAAGAQRVQVGTVSQSCNKKAGYTIAVTSSHCASPTPAGAKLQGSVGSETLRYSVESNNPTTGGSTATVTGLLATSCTNQNARTVTNAKINGENSTFFVNYTGDSTLAADTYQDTLTITMNVN